jgi:hypothetical protein
MPERTLNDTLQELDAGIFVNKVTEALRKVALGVVNHNKKGTVTIQLDIDRIGESDSVQVKHTVKYNQPTLRGKLVEDNTTSTPLHVSRFGDLSISPLSQADLFKDSNSSPSVSQIKGVK